MYALHFLVFIFSAMAFKISKFKVTRHIPYNTRWLTSVIENLDLVQSNQVTVNLESTLWSKNIKLFFLRHKEYFG